MFFAGYFSFLLKVRMFQSQALKAFFYLNYWSRDFVAHE